MTFEFIVLKWPPKSLALNPIEAEQENAIIDVQLTNLQQTCCYHVNMDKNLYGMFPAPCSVYATKNKIGLNAKGVQIRTGKVHQIKWSVSVNVMLLAIQKLYEYKP